MMSFEKDYASAKRHLGVAMIDLAYAAADLRNCAASCRRAGADRAGVAADLLQRELEQLRAICDTVETMAVTPDAARRTSGVAQWWPGLIRSSTLGID